LITLIIQSISGKKNGMTDTTEDFIRLIRHPIKFRIFLFLKLPSAFFAGVRVKSINKTSCIVTIPYKWFSQNPFRSTYFACLSMAAELSTGALSMAHLYKKKPPVSMLVLKVESDYHKKAVGVTTFTCNSGNEISNIIEETIRTGEGKIVRVHSLGTNRNGETVAEFWITWSFKARKA
jgi:hypothetical protein